MCRHICTQLLSPVIPLKCGTPYEKHQRSLNAHWKVTYMQLLYSKLAKTKLSLSLPTLYCEYHLFFLFISVCQSMLYEKRFNLIQGHIGFLKYPLSWTSLIFSYMYNLHLLNLHLADAFNPKRLTIRKVIHHHNTSNAK